MWLNLYLIPIVMRVCRVVPFPFSALDKIVFRKDTIAQADPPFLPRWRGPPPQSWWKLACCRERRPTETSPTRSSPAVSSSLRRLRCRAIRMATCWCGVTVPEPHSGCLFMNAVVTTVSLTSKIPPDK